MWQVHLHRWRARSKGRFSAASLEGQVLLDVPIAGPIFREMIFVSFTSIDKLPLSSEEYTS